MFAEGLLRVLLVTHKHRVLLISHSFRSIWPAWSPGHCEQDDRERSRSIVIFLSWNNARRESAQARRSKRKMHADALHAVNLSYFGLVPTIPSMRIVSYFTTRLMTDLPCQPSAIQSSDHVSHRIFRGPGTQNPGLCKTVWEFRNPTLPFSDTHLGTMRRWAKWIYYTRFHFPHIFGAGVRFPLWEPVRCVGSP